VVSGGNIDAAVLAQLLSDVRPRAPRKPRQRVQSANLMEPAIVALAARRPQPGSEPAARATEPAASSSPFTTQASA
jgi:threonine dehydratase